MSKNVAPSKFVHAPTKWGRYVRSMVYGGMDGIVTTFAVVAGVSGANLSYGVLLIIGFANLIADGISMGVGEYLSAKAENDFKQAEVKYEKEELIVEPDHDDKELQEFFTRLGVSVEDSEKIVDILEKYPKALIEELVIAEFQNVPDEEDTIIPALWTFGSFVIFGFVPLCTYVVAPYIPWVLEYSFLTASILTAMTMFLLGITKARFTGIHWFRSGVEVVSIGVLTALVAYGIGDGLAMLLGGN